jgi:adenine deaminase
MSRRLNQEAAKAIMYGGVSEEEAWKMVTINPAKLLHVDNRTGSIKAGKDADVVLWNNNPLSIYAKAEMTFVEGIKFFDLQEDAKKRDDIRKERERIIQKMILAKKNGDATQPIQRPSRRGSYHCDENHDEGN